MNKSPWADEKETSQLLGVSQQTLREWREIGYLKPGTHWRSSPSEESVPWTPKVIYHVSWCREIIEYWREEDAPVSNMAA
tara:strand:+ start:240 stop:479 length:240 start_codon:yes stop_codon:yes gene_type:complete